MVLLSATLLAGVAYGLKRLRQRVELQRLKSVPVVSILLLFVVAYVVNVAYVVSARAAAHLPRMRKA